MPTVSAALFPRWPPAGPARADIPAGESDLGRRTPEPCAQVQILLGALLRGINSNTLTILVGNEPDPVTCGNARALPGLAPGSRRHSCDLQRPIGTPACQEACRRALTLLGR